MSGHAFLNPYNQSSMEALALNGTPARSPLSPSNSNQNKFTFENLP